MYIERYFVLHSTILFEILTFVNKLTKTNLRYNFALRDVNDFVSSLFDYSVTDLRFLFSVQYGSKG